MSFQYGEDQWRIVKKVHANSSEFFIMEQSPDQKWHEKDQFGCMDSLENAKSYLL